MNVPVNVSTERVLREVGALYIELQVTREALEATREKVRALEEAATSPTDGGTAGRTS